MSKRVPLILAMAKGMGKTIVDSISQLEYWVAAQNNAPSFQNELRWNFPDGSVLRVYLMRIAQNINLAQNSTGTDGLWSVYLLIPKVLVDENGIPSQPFNIGTRIYRRLKRMVKSAANTDASGNRYLLGPWSPQEIAELRPAFADKYLKEQIPATFDGDGNVLTTKPKPGALLSTPIIISGESAEKLASIDYRPTDQEVDDDIEGIESTLFPEE